jgi:hypothetical protein
MTADDSIFVLDANVFIEAARRYYAFDLAPGFWESLMRHAAEGTIRSIDRIKHELERGQDDLANWARTDFSHAFASTNEVGVIESFGQIMIWVHAQGQFSDAAKAEFADAADGWLVAYAKVNGCTVVTHEALAPDARRRVPIPNVCYAFDVPFLDTFEMLRGLGIRLG